MSKPNEPDFATWLRYKMEIRGLTQSDLGRVANIPKPTVTTFLSRRTRRPTMEMSQRLSHGLELPVLAVTIAAGYTDRQQMGESEEATWATMSPWMGALEPAQRSIAWSKLGRAVIVEGLLSGGASDRQLAEARWESRGVRGPTEASDALGTDRRLGVVGVVGLLDSMPGAELSLLVEGAGGGESDVIGVAAIMGRIGPGLCRAWGCEDDWESWAAAVGTMLRESGGDLERFDARAYLEACRRVSWSVATTIPERSADLDLVRVLDALTPDQAEVVRSLFRSWGYLTKAQKH